MSTKQQNDMLDCLLVCGSTEDAALETVIEMVEDYGQNELQEDLLLEFQECY